MIRPHHLASLALAASACTALPASAAESFDSCDGRFIDSLPATISTPGVWCLRHDVSTAIGAGAAIQVAANNVTLDCNGFRIGGLAAGTGSMASGVYASGRQNTTVRNCGIRGFYYGVLVEGGAGHLVEDNRMDNNLLNAIRVNADNSRVRRNAAFDTGGAVGRTDATAIIGSADITDNTISGVFAQATPSMPVGIIATAGGQQVSRNVIRGLTPSNDGVAYGIVANAAGITVDGNRVAAAGPVNGMGIVGVSNTFCINNTVAYFSAGVVSCRASASNDSFQ
jgi:hypothetical protein